MHLEQDHKRFGGKFGKLCPHYMIARLSSRKIERVLIILATLVMCTSPVASFGFVTEASVKCFNKMPKETKIDFKQFC